MLRSERVARRGSVEGHHARQHSDSVVEEEVDVAAAIGQHAGPDQEAEAGRADRAWEKQVLSARGVKRVGRHSEYSIYTVWRCIGRGPGGSSELP